MQLLRVLSIILILLTFGIAYMVYPILPDEIPTHWNIQGQVDGTMPVFPGTLLIPNSYGRITLLTIILPRYDPKWEAYHNSGSI